MLTKPQTSVSQYEDTSFVADEFLGICWPEKLLSQIEGDKPDPQKLQWV